MAITTCEQFVLATLQLYQERADKAEAEVEKLKKQLYEDRDSKFAVEIRKRGLDSLYNSVLSYDLRVYRGNGLFEFDDWCDAVVDDFELHGVMTKDEFIEEFNEELCELYGEQLSKYEEKHGTDRA